MLEIRYQKKTGLVTAWWGDRHGNHEAKLKNRPNETMAMLDIPIPDKPLDAWLFDSGKLIPNPDYIEQKQTISLLARVKELEARLSRAGVAE